MLRTRLKFTANLSLGKRSLLALIQLTCADGKSFSPREHIASACLIWPLTNHVSCEVNTKCHRDPSVIHNSHLVYLQHGPLLAGEDPTNKSITRRVLKEALPVGFPALSSTTMSIYSDDSDKYTQATSLSNSIPGFLRVYPHPHRILGLDEMDQSPPRDVSSPSQGIDVDIGRPPSVQSRHGKFY